MELINVENRQSLGEVFQHSQEANEDGSHQLTIDPSKEKSFRGSGKLSLEKGKTKFNKEEMVIKWSL